LLRKWGANKNIGSSQSGSLWRSRVYARGSFNQLSTSEKIFFPAGKSLSASDPQHEPRDVLVVGHFHNKTFELVSRQFLESTSDSLRTVSVKVLKNRKKYGRL
jgi:hypothetical protein